MHNCYAIEDLVPVVHPTAFVHPTAVLIGDVEIGPGCYGTCASLRGDFARVIMREGSNIQDGCIMHGFPGGDAIIDVDGHVGHGAVIHGAHVGRNVLIGIQAVLMDNAVIGEDAVIGAMAYVPEGMVVPPKSLVVGVPARIVRTLAEKDLGWKRGGTLEYQELTRRCLATLRPVQPLTTPQENRPRYEGRISKTLSEVRGKTTGG